VVAEGDVADPDDLARRGVVAVAVEEAVCDGAAIDIIPDDLVLVVDAPGAEGIIVERGVVAVVDVIPDDLAVIVDAVSNSVVPMRSLSLSVA